MRSKGNFCTEMAEVRRMEDLEYLEFKVAVLDGDSYDEICISDPVTISFE